MAKYNWPELIADFYQSGVSQAAFCRANNLNPKYFNFRLKRSQRKSGEVFAKVERSAKPAMCPGLSLQVGQCTINCPESMPLPVVAELVRSLA